MTVNVPPAEIATAKLEARAAQLLQMLKASETMLSPLMSRLMWAMVPYGATVVSPEVPIWVEGRRSWELLGENSSLTGEAMMGRKISLQVT
jgi:hypothetical protein